MMEENRPGGLLSPAASLQNATAMPPTPLTIEPPDAATPAQQ